MLLYTLNIYFYFFSKIKSAKGLAEILLAYKVVFKTLLNNSGKFS